MKTLLITRPQADAAELAAILSAKGFRCLCEPMLTIELTDTGQFLERALERKPQAILITSKHALIQLSQLTHKRDMPLLVVGEASAAHAGKLGFTVVQEAGGTADSLIKTVSANLKHRNGPLLYLRGEHISVDIVQALTRQGFEVDSVTVYRARATPQFSAQLREKLEAGDIETVLFFSERSAAIYAGIAIRHGLHETHMRMTALCMSQTIAEKAVSIEWQDVYVAEKPTLHAMIALAESFAV